MSTSDFMQKYARAGFRWTSTTQKNSARAYRVPLTYQGHRVYEAKVKFVEGNVSEVILSLYNRGDAGMLAENEFFRIVQGIGEGLTSWSKVRAAKVQGRLKTGRTKKDARAWKTDANQMLLEWSYTPASKKDRTGFKSEYIRLQLTSSESSKRYSSAMQNKKTMDSAVSRSKLKAKVKKESNGDVYVSGVPMVDQGDKGYCVVATMERIMSLYGREVDQHEMAQVAKTSSSSGTSMQNMIDALRRLSIKMGCKLSIHQNWEWKAFLRMLNDYNRVAKKSNRRQIRVPTSGVIQMGSLYGMLEPDVWRETMVKKKSAYTKFRSTVMKYVKQGMPLPWTVYTGIFEEKPRLTGRGGHMRMIIGYNTKTGEIIYTDSWGAGHEVKRIGMDEAWTMTCGLYTVEPKQMMY